MRLLDGIKGFISARSYNAAHKPTQCHATLLTFNFICAVMHAMFKKRLICNTFRQTIYVEWIFCFKKRLITFIIRMKCDAVGILKKHQHNGHIFVLIV